MRRSAGVEQELKKRDRTIRLLFTLAENGGMLDAETAVQLMQVDPFTFWGDIQVLEETGMIMVGERSQNGRGISYLVLTTKGRSRILKRQILKRD